MRDPNVDTACDAQGAAFRFAPHDHLVNHDHNTSGPQGIGIVNRWSEPDEQSCVANRCARSQRAILTTDPSNPTGGHVDAHVAGGRRAVHRDPVPACSVDIGTSAIIRSVATSRLPISVGRSGVRLAHAIFAEFLTGRLAMVRPRARRAPRRSPAARRAPARAARGTKARRHDGIYACPASVGRRGSVARGAQAVMPVPIWPSRPGAWSCDE